METNDKDLALYLFHCQEKRCCQLEQLFQDADEKRKVSVS